MNWSENKNKFYFIIIVILVIVILLQKCGGGKNTTTSPNNDTITTIDTVYHTVIKEVATYIPKYTTKIKYIHDVTSTIDTVFVVNDYNSKYVYNDSLKNDTLSLYINDIIFKNKLLSRNIKYTIKFPTVTINNTVIKNKNEFYTGVGLVGSNTGINYFGPEFLLRTKKKSVYGLGVGINGNLQPNISLRIYWKIGKK
jgi:hypothetical protein